MTKRDEIEDDGLEAFFAAARAEAPRPSAALMGGILADAEAARGPWWRRAALGLGGWPALTGLAAATVAGVWIGAAVPDQVGTLTSGYLVDTYDFSGFSPELGAILAEG